MKTTCWIFLVITVLSTACNNMSRESQAVTKATVPAKAKHLFMDVHNFEPGKVTVEGVAEAHQKDLATQDKYGVSFIKYWVDETKGKVYCLAEAEDSAAVSNTHKEAHGLVPDLVGLVTDGPEAKMSNGQSLYFDIHHLGAGKVTAQAVAEAHTKDLAVQNKHNVNFINYWVAEKPGVVFCLAEANDPQAIIQTHTEAHGLVPLEVHKVKQGE